jgi:signal transduction histidine kinase
VWGTSLSRSETFDRLAAPGSAQRLALLSSTLVFLAALIAAVVAGSVVGLALIPMNMRDAVTFVAVLALSLLGTGAIGFAALAYFDRAYRLSLATRTFLGVATGALVALANVVIVAVLMFVNTGHDLGLLIALVVSGSGVTLIFGVRLAATTAGEIDPMRDALHRLASGELAPGPVMEPRTAELAKLGEDIERLRVRLAEVSEERALLDRERQELTASISHDLRTPLGSVRAMAEALADGVVSEAGERSDYYQRIRRETERLTRMVDELFELAQIDAGALRLQVAPLQLQDVAAEVVEAMQPLAREAGVELTLEVDGAPSEVALDGARMERAIGNLVRNALEHSPEGEPVRVSVGSDVSSGVTLSVHNRGTVIASEELSRVWERFYRGDSSRTRRSRGGADGAGLGLAIVKGIVETHEGSVGVTSAAGAGTTFSIRLPG